MTADGFHYLQISSASGTTQGRRRLRVRDSDGMGPGDTWMCSLVRGCFGVKGRNQESRGRGGGRWETEDKTNVWRGLTDVRSAVGLTLHCESIHGTKLSEPLPFQAVGSERPSLCRRRDNRHHINMVGAIHALVKETLRWRPALPLGLPHTTTEDDWYGGMFIPKGTICLANLWQCHHDPAAYGDDAASFNPERFLDEQGRLISGPVETRDDGHCTYGFGKRVCVGKHAANDTLFITMATVLWATRLEPEPKSGEGMPLDTETPVDTGVVFRPVPYICRITPRFPEAPSLLAEELKLLL
ncbi:cytochrome P450 [Russula dissimulans]|nr:cytochrome P450 [Russula dissimulans]